MQTPHMEDQKLFSLKQELEQDISAIKGDNAPNFMYEDYPHKLQLNESPIRK